MSERKVAEMSTALFIVGVELSAMKIQCFAASAARLSYQRWRSSKTVYGASTAITPWDLSRIAGEFPDP